ncbi:unnamed protein product [Protopolystoma xenopodis]|uniref:Uncharacterized protein n=1 Tax=Protopolystoma xenopodis TaxID=117903 RepID=A0A3S5CQS3_9PLAT|nr:unnamed protein product [Protopolystoma xenopodis]
MKRSTLFPASAAFTRNGFLIPPSWMPFFYACLPFLLLIYAPAPPSRESPDHLAHKELGLQLTEPVPQTSVLQEILGTSRPQLAPGPATPARCGTGRRCMYMHI